MTSVDLQNARLSQVESTNLDAEQALSAYVDGQGVASSIDLSDPALKQRWTEYQLISDALRDPSSLTPVSQAFTARMSAALARELAHGHLSDTSEAVEVVRPSFWERTTMAWPGLAVASAVASVVWIAQPLFGLEQGIESPVTVQTVPSEGVAVTQDGSSPTADYVSAHRHLAGPIAPRQVAFMPGGD